MARTQAVVLTVYIYSNNRKANTFFLSIKYKLQRVEGKLVVKIPHVS